MKEIGTPVEQNESYLKREDYQKNLVRIINGVREKIELGGGKKAIEKQHAKGKLTARERINLLIDESSDFIELNTFTAHDMYKEYG